MINGRVGYYSQDPWLLNASVIDNIILDLPYDEVRFHAVVEAASLTSDINGMPYGAETIVGDNGGTISGGQKVSVLISLYSISLMCDVLILPYGCIAHCSTLTHLPFASSPSHLHSHTYSSLLSSSVPHFA